MMRWREKRARQTEQGRRDRKHGGGTKQWRGQKKTMTIKGRRDGAKTEGRGKKP